LGWSPYVAEKATEGSKDKSAIKIPGVKVPSIKIPTIKIPSIKIPKL